MTDFTSYLLQTENLLIVASVWVLMSVLRRVFPRLTGHRLYARFAPVLPIVLCTASALVLMDDSVSTRIMLGIVLGAMASNGHKVFKQTALGDDQRIRKNERFL